MEKEIQVGECPKSAVWHDFASADIPEMKLDDLMEKILLKVKCANCGIEVWEVYENANKYLEV